MISFFQHFCPFKWQKYVGNEILQIHFGYTFLDKTVVRMG